VPALAAILAAALTAVAGCGLQPNEPTPTPPPTATPSPTPVPTPTPWPHPVARIVLVAAPGETQPGSRSQLAWLGIADAAGRLGSATSLISPLDASQLSTEVTKAAAGATPGPSATPDATPLPAMAGGMTVVVTAGRSGALAALAAAPANPATQFLILDQWMAADAPANVHGLVFDGAEAGYLAGLAAADASATPVVGFVALSKTDPGSVGYLAGMANGVLESNPAATVTPAYVGSTADPARGRAAVNGLVKAGAGAIIASPDLTGYGAMRQACADNLALVALATDASLLLPDVQPCLVASVVYRYDFAVRDAIVALASGQALPHAIVSDVASGGLVLSFVRPASPILQARLALVLAWMLEGPPRPTPSIASPAPTASVAAG
jgi:basic membrane lipoprotein Med (substrate-binding protein (PBP1-ABC) superfamily)